MIPLSGLLWFGRAMHPGRRKKHCRRGRHATLSRLFGGLLLWALTQAPALAEEGDVLSEPHTWEGGGLTLALKPVPVPLLSGTEPEVQQILRGVRQELKDLVQQPGGERGRLAEAFGQTGRYYHAHHLYGPASACYSNAEQLAPGEFRWPYLLGYTYYQASHPDQAVAAYQRALELNPGDPAAQLRLARVYFDLNQPELGEPLLEKPLEVAGLREVATSLKGEAALVRRDYASAARYFEQVLAEDPQATKIHYPLAMAYRGLGDMAAARRHLQLRDLGEPRMVDPLVDDLGKLLGGARTHYFRAIEAARDAQYEEAVDNFTWALALDPDNVNARVSLARSLYLAGDREAAGKELAAALERDPAHVLGNFLMGALLEESGKPDVALEHYRKALVGDPEHAGANFYLANALMRRGQFAEAAEHYAKAWRADPKSWGSRLAEAVALVLAGAPPAQARDRLERAAAVYPEQIAFSFALARLLATSPDDQVRDGTQALALAETLFDGLNSLENAETLAMAYAAVGRYEDAVALQKSAISATAAARQFSLLPRLEAALARYENGQRMVLTLAFEDRMLQPPPLNAVGPFRNYPTLHAY
jgi:tetratricopeptide (TPR) repeat protein